ncbi:sigma-54 interaction domain-containing protein [Neptunomonas qingdaonensis]|uniref:sigma-54 interaction domain-containing protein n=1 Tax=Neptunomonas qingdaonensis TaxID=1045558 RepID=UPI001E366A15|nr:sigma 54-interacting transcriptional regulator [Neptunomonas qingdaonensis]
MIKPTNHLPEQHICLDELLSGQTIKQHPFELLSSLCEGAIAVDTACRIIWMSPKYRQLINIPEDKELIGTPIEELLPNTQLPRVLKSGKPTFVDLMQINGRWCVVTRMPLKDNDARVMGAIGFIFYTDLESLRPLFDKFARLKRQLEQQKLIRPSRYALDDLIGQSAIIQQLKRQARRAALLDTTVLLLGETGTGKELLAQGIHHASQRNGGPFVGINMAALPESLVEAELFGAAPGAYTGIDKNGRKGKIQLADGGTLFLDEIAEMPLSMQAKLLRVLQEREVEALGSNRLEHVDLRVIAATSGNLKQLVDEGKFRADLYYRLNVLPIRLAPLRERKEDIPLLCAHILQSIQQQAQIPALALTDSALAWLFQYSWPGNVRELHNRLERGCVMAEGTAIEPEDLGALDDLPCPDSAIVTGIDTDTSLTSLAETRLKAEQGALQDALQQTRGNKSSAAKLLGISRATLYERLKKSPDN